MFKSIPAITAIGMLITPVLAMGASATEADANGDGLITIEEAQAAIPDITAEAFATMDINGDGALDGDEVTAAQDAGLMPPSDG